MTKAKTRFYQLVSATALLILVISAPNATAQQMEVIDNAKVIQLVKAGFNEQIVISKINSSKVNVDSSETALLEMKSAGVADSVIVALLQRSGVGGAKADVCRSGQFRIPGGTEIKVVTLRMISGKSVKIGQVLDLAVAEDLRVDGTLVVAKDNIVKAMVFEARKPGMIGRSGRVSIRFESTTAVDGTLLKLRAGKSGAGGDNFGTSMTLSVFWGLGLLIPGKNAEIKPGTMVTALTDESKCISLVALKP